MQVDNNDTKLTTGPLRKLTTETLMKADKKDTWQVNIITTGIFSKLKTWKQGRLTSEHLAN